MRFALGPRLLVVLVAALLIVWFANLDARRLIKSDEGRYSEIAREMAVSGDWLTPRLNDFKYFEKPPLQYWATAAAYKMFGVDEWTARLWTALTGLATVLFTGYFAGRVFGRDVGIAAAVVAASSMLLVALSHMLTLDMGLTCFMTFVLGGFLLAQRDGATENERRRWMLAAWAAMALAVLSKGLMAVALPAAVLALYVLWQRDFALLTRIRLGSGLLLFLLIAAPWFIAVSIVNPEFPRFFFYHEHVERFMTRVHERYAPWWFFVPVLLAGTLPWTLLLPRALIAGRRRDPATAFQPARLLWLWSVFIFIFFSSSSSKLASYLLPIVPALAVLIALSLRNAPKHTLRRAWVPVIALALGALAYTPWMRRMGTPDIPAELFSGYMPWAGAAFFILAAGLMCALVLDRRGRDEYDEDEVEVKDGIDGNDGGGGRRRLDDSGRPRGRAVLIAGFSALLSFQLLLTGHNALAPAQSSWHLVQQIKPWLAPNIPLYSVRFYDHTLDFYLGRTVTLVAIQTELAFGIKQEPQKYVPTVDEFARLWHDEAQALAVTSDDYFPTLQASGLPLIVVARDTRRVVFRKP